MDSIMGFAQQFLENHQPQNEDDRQIHHAAVNEARNNIDSHQDPDPEQVRQAHQQIYQNGQVPEDSDPNAIGGAIVTQVMSQLQSSGGGDMQQQLLSAVMNEASSVMGGSGGGLKQKVMVQAAMMAMKAQLGGSGGGGGGMFGGMMSHMMGGGGGGGGMDPSTLLSIASKFM